VKRSPPTAERRGPLRCEAIDLDSAIRMGFFYVREIVWRSPSSCAEQLTRRLAPTMSRCQPTVPLRSAFQGPPQSG
jgi:hypothetical protein